MKCPSCNQSMAEKVVKTPRGLVYYDKCPACGGIWFDAGEMDAAVLQVFHSVERSSTDRAEGISEATRECPRCPRQILDKVFFLTYSDILLDYCRTCHGFWLDGGEFRRINQNLRELKKLRDDADVGPAGNLVVAFLSTVVEGFNVNLFPWGRFY